MNDSDEWEAEKQRLHQANFEKMNSHNWTLEGVAGSDVLKDMPDVTRDMVDADVFAVFRDGNEILLKPATEVEP